MNLTDIAHARLANQRLTATTFTTAAEVVAWLVAVQAQEYAGAKAALGLRARGLDDAAVERAFAAGEILRSHVLRPTWHFVAPADVRWLLKLTAPRVHQANGGMYRRLELDGATLARSANVITTALRDGRALTRDQLRQALAAAGIATSGGPNRDGQRLAYIVMWAELEGLIVSGPRLGKQFSYRLLDERAPAGGAFDRDAALAELARRYMQSHGPATAADLANWSGLTLTDARRGIAAARPALLSEAVEGQTYWFADAPLPPPAPSPTAYLLSIYDETIIGYKDRRAIVSAEDGARLGAMGNALQNVIVIDGRVVGTWRRTLGRETLGVELNLFRALSEVEQAAMAVAQRQVAEFYGLESS
jgi:hypothetical protein